MSNPVLLPNRRVFLRTLTLGVMTLMARGACAQALVPTPRQTEGPFYPDKLPFDTDNDLLVINDGLTPAVGEVTHLSGRILDVHGDPIRNALVEIWQVDNQGVYLHSGSANREKRDVSFQGFGRFLTGQSGEYYFRTIKPVPYPSRPAPHIHFAIKMKGRRKSTARVMSKAAGRSTRWHPQCHRGPTSAPCGHSGFRPAGEVGVGELAARFGRVLRPLARGLAPKMRSVPVVFDN